MREKPDTNLYLSNPDSWDGQEMVDFSTPEEIGSVTELTTLDQFKYIVSQIGRNSGYPVISIAKILQGYEEGQAFFGDGE